MLHSPGLTPPGYFLSPCGLAEKDMYKRVTEVVSLESSILFQAVIYQERYRLSVQDSVVYASVLSHLERSATTESCFLNRDLGFGDPGIVDELSARRCKLLPGFEAGLQSLRRPSPGGAVQ